MLPSSSNDPPPPPNPILTAYENFVNQTPLVTRTILNAQFASYLASWFINPFYALSNIPQFTLYKYEVYRLVTSPLVNTSIFSLLFAVVSFVGIGKRLEFAMGSAAFGWLCFTISLVTNVVFLLFCVAMSLLTPSGAEWWLLKSAHGIWLVLFGIISLECSQEDDHQHGDGGGQQSTTVRQYSLLGRAIPARYYPLVLFAVFGLLSGGDFSVAYLVSLTLGYLLARIKAVDGRTATSTGSTAIPILQKMRGFFFLSGVQIQQWEGALLARWTTNPGWVTGTGTGTGASGITMSSGAAGDRASSRGGGIFVSIQTDDDWPIFLRIWVEDTSNSRSVMMTGIVAALPVGSECYWD